MKKIFYWVLLVLFLPLTAQAQDLSNEEQVLYDLIMTYRDQLGLPQIPLSPSLNAVARTHTRDLMQNRPHNESCNTHSWSNHGNWSSCCYTPDHKQARCMWDKPRELTSYTGNGYEIAYRKVLHGINDEIRAEHALRSWQKSRHHNAVIINQGPWKKHKWKAIGISIFGSFATVWFGDVPDS
ncbi:MAG: CAP domain-containing protein [Saprospiraceae bacterium]|nr:CAP domain-containing protein [Saprospiraceae bacterium]